MRWHFTPADLRYVLFVCLSGWLTDCLTQYVMCELSHASAGLAASEVAVSRFVIVWASSVTCRPVGCCSIPCISRFNVCLSIFLPTSYVIYDVPLREWVSDHFVSISSSHDHMFRFDGWRSNRTDLDQDRVSEWGRLRIDSNKQCLNSWLLGINLNGVSIVFFCLCPLPCLTLR